MSVSGLIFDCARILRAVGAPGLAVFETWEPRPLSWVLDHFGGWPESPVNILAVGSGESNRTVGAPRLETWVNGTSGPLQLARPTLSRVAGVSATGARRRNPERSEGSRGLVGTGRFELPTPRTPSECSTRLSHVPTGDNTAGWRCWGRHHSSRRSRHRFRPSARHRALRSRCGRPNVEPTGPSRYASPTAP